MEYKKAVRVFFAFLSLKVVPSIGDFAAMGFDNFLDPGGTLRFALSQMIALPKYVLTDQPHST